VIQIRVRGNDDDWQIGTAAADSVEQRNTIHTGHAHIRYKNVGTVMPDCFEQVFGALKAPGFHARLVQRFLENPAQRLIIVDNPDS
jgi:hypothetical protein